MGSGAKDHMAHKGRKRKRRRRRMTKRSRRKILKIPPTPMATEAGLGQTYRIGFETEQIWILTPSLISSLNLLFSL